MNRSAIVAANTADRFASRPGADYGIGRADPSPQSTPHLSVQFGDLETSPGRIGRYLKGAETTAYYPVSVVTDGQGLNITVQGYLGGLHFGLIACRELVPDVDKLTGYLVDELDLLSS